MMNKNFTLAVVLAAVMFSFVSLPPAAEAKPSEYEQIVNHFKSRYGAKKVKIPMLWLARFAVSVVRPAGVKSFSVTMFEDLKNSPGMLDKELQTVLDLAYAEGWTPAFRVRSRDGQQAYMYMRDAGKDIRITLVTIDKTKAAIIRATFNPEKLVDFANDPKLFGISLSNGQNGKPPASRPVDPNAVPAAAPEPVREPQPTDPGSLLTLPPLGTFSEKPDYQPIYSESGQKPLLR